MATIPWPFTDLQSVPPERLIPNVPSEDGAALGNELARFAEHEISTGKRDERCHDCAFRLGSKPNQCLKTVADALKCVVEGEPFYCHHGVEDVIDPEFGADQIATRLCAGYQLFKKKPIE